MRAKLKDLVIGATTDPSVEVAYEVPEGAITVGRGGENRFVIPHVDYREYKNDAFTRILGTVSRAHCTLYKDESGLYVEDSGSYKGTFVRRERRIFPGRRRRAVRVHEKTRLKNGDRLSLGDYELEVVLA